MCNSCDYQIKNTCRIGKYINEEILVEAVVNIRCHSLPNQSSITITELRGRRRDHITSFILKSCNHDVFPCVFRLKRLKATRDD